MTSRSEDFRVSGDEENVVYEGEEGDVGTPVLGGSSAQFSKQEREGSFSNESNNGNVSHHDELENVPLTCDISQNSYDREAESGKLHPGQNETETQFREKNGSTDFLDQSSTVYVGREDMVDMGESKESQNGYRPDEFNSAENTQDVPQEEQDSTKSNVQEHAAGCTLYVRNLPPHIRSEHVKEHFAQFGEVIDCRIIMNPVTKDSRGFGFVSFATPEIADLAMEKSADVRIEGKLLRVEKARRNRPHDPTPGEYKGPTGASIKYDNCGRLKPGYVPYWHLPFVKGDHGRDSRHGRRYHRSFSRDQGRLGSYRGGMSRRNSGDYPSRHMRHYNDSPGGRDYGYYRGTSQNRVRSPPCSSKRLSYQGASPVRGSSRNAAYHRSTHYGGESSRDSALAMNKPLRKPYNMETLDGEDDNMMRRHRSSSRYSRHQDFNPPEPHRHGQSHHSSNLSNQWERSSRGSYQTHSSKDHHRAAPYLSSHRSLRNNDYCLGTNMDPSHQSSTVYGSRHGSRGRPYDEHECYGSSASMANVNSERYATGSYPHGGSSQLRSRGVSGEGHYSPRGPSSAYGTSGVSRRRISQSPPSSRYGQNRNTVSNMMRSGKASEQSGNLYASNERMQRHMSSTRSRSPLDVRGAPMSSSFVCHH